MKRKIYKGGVDNYPLWWYGQSNRLQNFGDRTNFLVPNGPIFKGNGYYFDGNDDYMEDIYGRHLLAEGTNGVWSQLYLTDSALSPCGSAVGIGDSLYLSINQAPVITGKLVLYPKSCPALTSVYCGYNQISVLDVSQLTTLTKLYCKYNQISVLDVSNDSQITQLDCHDNQMDQDAVDKVLCDANAWNTSNGTLNISGNTAPSQTGIDAKNDMVNNRGWTVTTD